MTELQAEQIHQCAAQSLAGAIHFGEVVRRMSEVGVERYHLDYCRQECTYYLPDGSTVIVPIPQPTVAIAQEFSAKDVEAAIRSAQRGEVKFPQFLEKTRAAGCVGYFAQFAGRRVIYFGRTGEFHIEPFPPVPAS